MEKSPDELMGSAYLALDIILVNLGKRVFGKLQCDSEKNVQGVQDLRVERLMVRVNKAQGSCQE